ncbi:MAG: hypothetical protein ACOYI4_02485 [Christensenellales bacterium]|jgi:hypothetical protein
MLKVIFGKKGEGKTKRIIGMANSGVDTLNGNAIFIDDDSRYMFDVSRQIRFIDASEYHIDSPKMFYGFLCGLAAQDYDLERIYIDGFLKIVHYPLEDLQEFFESANNMAEKFNLDIIISVCGDNTPDFIQQYVITD